MNITEFTGTGLRFLYFLSEYYLSSVIYHKTHKTASCTPLPSKHWAAS